MVLRWRPADRDLLVVEFARAAQITRWHVIRRTYGRTETWWRWLGTHALATYWNYSQWTRIWWRPEWKVINDGIKCYVKNYHFIIPKMCKQQLFECYLIGKLQYCTLSDESILIREHMWFGQTLLAKRVSACFALLITWVCYEILICSIFVITWIQFKQIKQNLIMYYIVE